MPTGFFSGSQIASKKSLPLIAQCGSCGLYKTCKTPYMKVSGRGNGKVLIVGEAPGKDEDRKGKPFVGKTGQRLRDELRGIGVDPDRDCWFTNALICRPPDNRIVDANAVSYCRPNLLKTIDELQPKTIILLGGKAIESLIGFLWKEDVGEVGRWIGWNIPSQRYNCWVCPTYHPSYIERANDRIYDRMFTSHLKKAFDHKRQPWKKVPDYKSQVRIELDAEQAAKTIRSFALGARQIVAIDYETDRLKPDSGKARIVCCAISDGKTTIAYPWYGKAIIATGELLIDPRIGKIASNLKFEERWTRAKLKVGVANWKWDTMVAAHVIDNRPSISSIKFQSFVLLGQEEYDGHIKSFLRTKEPGGNTVNTIRDCGLTDLLLYCGMDALLEWKVAQIQMKELGHGHLRERSGRLQT